MNRPRSISAVIPSFNSAAFLPDAIISILKQTHPVDEIIVVDDGSTDNTNEIVAQYHGRVSYIYQSNAGPSAARNHGIECAAGEWIAFLDADDIWVSDKISRQVELIHSHPEISLVSGDMAEFDQDLNILVPSVLERHGMKEMFEKIQNNPLPNALPVLLEKNFIPTGTVLVKKESIQTVGMFNTKIHYGEDLELWAKIAAKLSITCLPEVLMFRRKHDSNVTGATESMLIDLVKVMGSLREWTKINLPECQVDLNPYLSKAWSDLGYYYFSKGSLGKARKAFLNSMLTRISKRSVLYGVASFLPMGLINLIKKLKYHPVDVET